jgi:type II secretory pathway component GspD/PulD (secretin)
MAFALTTISVPVIAVEKRESESPPRPKLLTVDYANAEVTDVIRALASQSGMNVAINPSVKGQVTVQLREKTVEEAIEMVANLAGLGARRVKNTYIVAPRQEIRATLERLGDRKEISLSHLSAKDAAEIAQNAFPDLTARPHGKSVMLMGATEDLEAGAELIRSNDGFSPDKERKSHQVTLKYRKAKETADTLTKMVPGLHAEVAGDSVILSGSVNQVEAGQRALAMLDVENQPNRVMRIYEIRYSAADRLIEFLKRVSPEVEVIPGSESYRPPKVSFSPLSGQFIGMEGLGNSANNSVLGENKIEKDGHALSLLLRGTNEDVEEAIKALRMVDVAPKQMQIEAKVVETSPERAEEIGLKYGWDNFRFYERGRGTPLDPTNYSATSPETRGLGFGQFTRAPWNIITTLSAMITRKEAKLLASPKISVLNDIDASIFIGDTLRFSTLASSSPTTGPVYTVVEVPVGIILLVHPRVNDDGNITLRVHPVVSTVTGFVNGIPQTAAREAETVVRVKDGDTLVIGGLIRDEDIKQMQKIPLLGDLPLVGHLFRHNSRSSRRTEVMVFLTIRMMQ